MEQDPCPSLSQERRHTLRRTFALSFIHGTSEKYGILRSSSMIMTGSPTTSKDSGQANSLSVVRSGYMNSELALGVCGAWRRASAADVWDSPEAVRVGAKHLSYR